MPIYDRRCETCGRVELDCFEPITTADPMCPCHGLMSRVWIGHPAAVISDECDVYVKHGICHEDGTPRRYRSKAEMRRAAKEKGLINYVEHKGTQGGDRSPHTSRWV